MELLTLLSHSIHPSFSTLHMQALLHQETGAMELLKELVRDCAEARIKLRDIGALSL